MEGAQATGGRTRKRKAENQDNDRLSKRLSLLNLGLYCSKSAHCSARTLANDLVERNGQKLYVPVERPLTPPKSKSLVPPQDDDVMHLDDTKHKVYIYDLDAELSDSESSDDGRLVFLPDIRKHLLESRILPSILANNEGELAGNQQLVLYHVPSSLTVPEEKDSVRKAIIETRARARAKQEEEQKRITGSRNAQTNGTLNGGSGAPDWYPGVANGNGKAPKGAVKSDASFVPAAEQYPMDDPDAMDLG